MATTKNLPQKLIYSPLSTALKTDNQPMVIRELSRMSIQKIMNARELHMELSSQLDQMRKSYRWFRDNSVEGRIKHMATLKKLGSDLSRELAEIPEYPNLYELRTSNEEEAIRVLMLMIIKVVEFFTTTEIMGKDMIQEVALRIVYQFGGLTLEDIALCFHQAQNGVHGKVFNRIDGAVLMDWLHKYEKDVRDIGEEKNRRIHNQGKGGIWKEGHEHRIIKPKRLNELV